MEVTYQREVSHCEVSPYVKMVTIKDIQPAQNSDFLDRVEFEELGWNAITKRGSNVIGETVMFIPPDSVLPFELSEALNITQYTNKGRVRVTKLRGNRSEGLIADRAIVEPYLPYIMKWEDLPTHEQMRGDAMPLAQTPYSFSKFYKMPNILNEPFTFHDGEQVWISEKIHGTNFRFGVFQNPETGLYDDYVGSHNVVLKYNEANLYWKAYNMYFNGCIPQDVLFFGEIYGPGVQDNFAYGLTGIAVAVFAIMLKGEYINPLNVMEYCVSLDLPVVSFHRHVFSGLEELREMADSPSEVTDKHGREGIVIVSDAFPNRMAKCIGFNYLAGKASKGKKTTERH